MPRGRNAKGKKKKTGANTQKANSNGSRRSAFHGGKISKTQLAKSWEAEVAAASATATIQYSKPKSSAKPKARAKPKPKTKKQLLQERGIDTRAGALRAMFEQLGIDAPGNQTDMINKVAELIKEFDAWTSVTDSIIDVSDLVKFVNSKK